MESHAIADPSFAMTEDQTFTEDQKSPHMTSADPRRPRTWYCRRSSMTQEMT